MTFNHHPYEEERHSPTFIPASTMPDAPHPPVTPMSPPQVVEHSASPTLSESEDDVVASGPGAAPLRPHFQTAISATSITPLTTGLSPGVSPPDTPGLSPSPSLHGNPFSSPALSPDSSEGGGRVPSPPAIQVSSSTSSPVGTPVIISSLNHRLPSSSGTLRVPGSKSSSVSSFTPRDSFSRPFADGEVSSNVSIGVSSAVESEVRGTKYTIAERRSARMKKSASATSGFDKDSLAPSSKKRGGPVKSSRPGGGAPDTKRKPFQSTRLKGEIYKPWLDKKDPAMRWARWITIVSIILGFAVAGVICWDGYASVPSLGTVCNILSEDWSSGSIDSSVWEHEVRLDGYGNGEFDWTTTSSNNSFIEDGIMYIVPTLTSDVLGVDAITNGYTLNLTADGTCTSTNVSQCVAVSNSSLLTVINPVMSARLITKNTVSLKYGRVEVSARFPTGDWLWPSIYMLPVNETYGAWPRSGQIDIMTGRGNNASYPDRGFDYAQSDLHWGPTVDLDREYLTWGYREQRRTYYNEKFHTYGLEWNEDYMWTYIDSKVSQVISLRFNKESFWTRGVFPSTITNNSVVEKLTNPWALSSQNVAPFDQSFYLILDLAVGGTSGWFPDGDGSKPWLDDSVSAMSDFWAAKDKWWATWPADVTKRGFAIKSVNMWKTC